MKKYIYLIQAKGQFPKHYHFLKKKSILLSYKENTEDTDIFFPNSSWTQGRNKLFEKAINDDYDYYIFLDEDLTLDAKKILYFERILDKYDYPIITPNMWDFNDYSASDGTLSGTRHARNSFTNYTMKIQTVDWFDGAFNAFNKNTIKQLLPYIERFDNECWWHSQRLLTIRANYLFKNNIIQINDLEVLNTQNSTYPQNPENSIKICDDYLADNNMTDLEMSTCIEIETKPPMQKMIGHVANSYTMINYIRKKLQQYKPHLTAPCKKIKLLRTLRNFIRGKQAKPW
ncbi:MAG: hypothetical protein HFP81_07810 [Methylococcales symbiont of Hymedesmia sp. n. MRB-2018]|nr:MAG: hypothetical protein HFP78_07735 [Methylococcales symbiont of Hymedesmia sp. n. MRB-2018]KAF3983422.1 MAG: hypothetical protein HFP81_07810 [Methylococcales symbiont of Hymedesmia sp. n. MRB-2018]